MKKVETAASIHKKIALVGGARPNFMKIAPLYHELKKQAVDFFVVNTGQHFDQNMSEQFLKEFSVAIDYTLSPDRSSEDSQKESIRAGLEDIFLKKKPALVVVVGDVNSTRIASEAAYKLNIPIAHVEAGLRSHNELMPEEGNRIVADKLSTLLFVTQEDGEKNLTSEGITQNVYMVGNVTMDTLSSFLPVIPKSDESFYFCTLHRAENVDHKEVFEDILNALETIAKDAPIYLPLHPRTKKMAMEFDLFHRVKDVFTILPPLSYADALYYEKNAKLVLTDSGGIQEETSFLGVPCITLRTETERPVTVTLGTNVIGGVTKESILRAYQKYTSGELKAKNVTIPLWDGKASERIVSIMKKFLS